jgi:murein DD-endopeptidase MepM/ murein hydrolase activator NlpD
VAALAALATTATADAPRLTWPVPHRGFLERQPLESFVQPTASGEPLSALFGCVRNSGARFHEGLDLAPLARDRSGEATDPIVAIADGIVRHIAPRAGDSGYGRYIVLEHPDLVPSVYTLYAHLRSVADNLAPGQRVQRGQFLGVMGRSAGGYSIPADRAHLHFEIGLRLSDDFPSWYARQGFGSPNRHGNWNGMNLVGFDPLAFFTEVRDHGSRQPLEHIAREPVAARVWVASRSVPSFARRYPELVDGEIPLGGPGGWEVDFTWYGLPLALRPREAPPADAAVRGRFTILSRERRLGGGDGCIQLVVTQRGRLEPGKDLRENLELLFGP